MGKAEYIVIGAWAVHGETGKVRHKPCRRWCNYYNEDNKTEHICDAIEDEDKDNVGVIQIPPTVMLVSECIRNKP